MNTRLDDLDVMEALAALRPGDDDVAALWHPGRRQAVLRRVVAEPAPRQGRAVASPWVGAVLAVAAAAVIALLLLPGMIGWGRPIDAVPAQTTRGPVTEPTWVRIANGPLPARYEARGAWIDGRYLLVSGHTDPCGPVETGCEFTGDLLADGALYDPDGDSWTTIAPVPLVRDLGEPVVVGDSAYFMTGTLFIGDEESNSRTEFVPGGEQILLRYQVDTDTWTSHPLPHPAGGQLVAADSAVIVLSGSDSDVEIADLVYHPDDDTWTELPDDPLGLGRVRYAVWAEGRLVLSTLPLDAADALSGPLELAVLDADLANWTRLDPPEQAYGLRPLAVGGRVVWEPDPARAEVVDDRRTFERLSVLDPVAGEVTTVEVSYKGYDGYPEGSLGELWMATSGRALVEGDLLAPTTGASTTVPALAPSDGVVLTTHVGGEDSLLLWGGAVPGAAEGWLLLLPPS
ncbi:MAG TPA: hypothetical protein PKA93_06980 [Arachnia sp.]|nr:hypothetical protein [Arachnia sp.]